MAAIKFTASDRIKLPYTYDALGPHISAATLHEHYDAHHRAYVEKLKGLLREQPTAANTALDDLVLTASGEVYNNAAQIWNHNFYWLCLVPQGSPLTTSSPLAAAMATTFGSFAAFKKDFAAQAAKLFGSGWTWLAVDAGGKLSIFNGHDADNPLRHGLTPLLTCDVWEHAYYLDYQHKRPDYVENFWHIVNWGFAEKCFADARELR